MATVVRVVGYFESWAQNRPCNVFWPEDIPVGLYTHINFAFATIDPVTFKVGPASQLDIGLYKRLALIKQKDPDLKLYIAIGGWTFNDPGPTQTVFSDLAASVPRQKVFIQSLISFMSTYGFDGVDLDWEYPRAPDRAGREVDYENFPKFMKRLKESLDGASKGISITLPASYWYLQHFDIVALAESVSWFNIMSYDLHGTWDKGNEWTGSFLNAHTNLTEIDLALDLLWRNDIDPSQVVLGLGFYGRAFTATSPSCLEPGCTFESGGEKGKCSREVGILLNSEIDDLVAKHGVKPKLYKKEAVKVAAWGNQWVAYDDKETFSLKSRYAQKMCLGGLMVWAISHDTKDAKYNKALAEVVNRKITSVPKNEKNVISDKPYDFVHIPNPQCKWTNCGEGCPSGWVHMKRQDDGARGTEYMWDETGCAGLGTHSFCCPPGDLPTCGWYTHHNGRCDSTCPEGTVEIGSNSLYCRWGYQAACCTTNHKSMRLYTTCEWGEKPMCDAQEGCPNSPFSELLAVSSSGTGGGSCNMRSAGVPASTWVLQEQKFCCDTSDKQRTFSDCEWYDGIGPRPDGSTEDWCRSGCPGDRVRVALDMLATECFGKGVAGGQARCCVPSYSDTIEVENPKLDAWRAALEDYTRDPTCPNPGPIGSLKALTRPVESIDAEEEAEEPFSMQASMLSNGSAAGLVKRAGRSTISTTESLLLNLLTMTGSKSMLEAQEEIWNDFMPEEFGTGLRMPHLRDYLQDLPAWDTEGPIELSHGVVCSPNYWAGLVEGGGGSNTAVNCSLTTCDIDGCEKEDLESRGLARLDKRVGAARNFQVDLIAPNGVERSVTITLPPYNQIRDLAEDDPMQDEALDFVSHGDCTNSRLTHFALPLDSWIGGPSIVVEHIFEGQMMMQFMEDAAAGRLRSGATATVGHVSISFFVQARTMPLPNPPPLPGGAQYVRLYDRVMECLGSQTNTANFVLLNAEINAFKAQLVKGNDPVDFDKIVSGAKDYMYPHYVLHIMKTTNAVIRYLNYQGTPNVNQRLTSQVNCAGEQWGYAEQVWNQNNPADQVAVLEFYRKWVRDYYEVYLIGRAANYVRRCAAEMRRHWEAFEDDSYSRRVLEVVRAIEDELDELTIDTRGFD
ncbi:hypothetical protein DL771_011637 [Monosporascus sp. 5C6A]|nr:hypothetical protein DL771_011637 [Monosporascus sp. 5C6A]